MTIMQNIVRQFAMTIPSKCMSLTKNSSNSIWKNSESLNNNDWYYILENTTFFNTYTKKL